MLALNIPFMTRLTHAPQIGAGTVDYLPFPPGGPRDPGGEPEEPASPGDAETASPSAGLSASLAERALPAGALGIAHAWLRRDQDPAEMDEIIAIFRAGAPIADLEPSIPDDGVVIARATDRIYQTPDAFRAHLTALRQARTTPIPCLVSRGVRHLDLRQDSEQHAALGIATWDIYRERDAELKPVGCGFALRLGPASTLQHWVLFGDRVFSQLRVVRRPEPITTLGAFLDQMAATRLSFDRCPHAVERVVHYPDLPWFSAP